MGWMHHARAAVTRRSQSPDLPHTTDVDHLAKYSVHQVLPYFSVQERRLRGEENRATYNDFIDPTQKSTDAEQQPQTGSPTQFPDSRIKSTVHPKALTREEELTIFESVLRLDQYRGLFRFMYHTIFPAIHLVGMFFTILLLGLLADGVINGSAPFAAWITLIPYFVFSVPAFFCLVAFRFLDANVLARRKEYLMRNVTHVRSENITATRMFALLGMQCQVGNLWVECLLFAILFRSLFQVWDTSFRVLCIPLYTFSLSYIVGIPLTGAAIFLGADSKGRWLLKYPLMLYLIQSVFLILLCVQMGLVSAKVDGIIGQRWQLVLLPTWMTIIISIILFLFISAVLGILFPYALVVLIPVVAFIAFIIIPIIVSFVLFILKMDAGLTYPYTIIFIPVLLLMLVVFAVLFAIAAVKYYYREEYARLLMKIR